jgi:N-formylglutamate amidohydrolase
MPRLNRGGDRSAPDVVLGDRYGTTCAPVLVDTVEMVFAAAGLKVARNRPYAGGHTTRTYGRPQYGIHALQIEFSRHLYMHELTLAKHQGFPLMQQLAETLLAALVRFDAVALARTQLAAE